MVQCTINAKFDRGVISREVPPKYLLVLFDSVIFVSKVAKRLTNIAYVLVDISFPTVPIFLTLFCISVLVKLVSDCCYFFLFPWRCHLLCLFLTFEFAFLLFGVFVAAGCNTKGHMKRFQ